MDRFAKVGNLMGDPGRRAEWRQMVRRLEDLSDTTLAGHLFHGTTLARYRRMTKVGFEATDVPLGTREGDAFASGPAEGTYWAKPLVAAYYAEDRIESTGNDREELVVLAVPIDVLKNHGELVQDEMSLEYPIETRLGMDVDQVDALYRRLVSEGMTAWEASLRSTHSLACLGWCGPDMSGIVALSSSEDVGVFLDGLEAAPSPGM